AGAAATLLIPTPWRYGDLYWVGQVPEYPEAYVNRATNGVESMCRIWGLGVPKPSGDWRTPQAVRAGSSHEARELLGPEFPAAGVIVPGPEEDTFWALRPLLVGERETNPLTLVLMPRVEDLQSCFCLYGVYAFMVPEPSSLEVLVQLGLPLPKAVQEIAGPLVVLPMAPDTTFQLALVHEVSHWLTVLWAERNGLEFRSLPSLLVEGLAGYAQYLYGYGEVQLAAASPLLLHPFAAAWAQRGGLVDVPLPLSYLVGTSLVHFLVRKNHNAFANVLRDLPLYLPDWPKHLAGWEGEWREWLRGEVPPEAFAYLRMAKEGLILAAPLVEPLFPQLTALLRGITREEEVAKFWDLLSGPPPTPTAEARAKLRARECTFRLAAQHADAPPEARAQLEELLEAMGKHWEAGDWDAYARAYLAAVLVLMERSVPIRPSVGNGGR
ncbi:MAG: FCD domain-containing protein, partial [Candidatus Bipolaricaulota bacterium]|nr:FCD domain-containing protein [Candidatus Bipolaricaulota bacterium]